VPLAQGGVVVGEIGKRLREARESKGLSLRDVEEATKIRQKYLKALENEKFEEIPGKTYAKGFFKNYCNYLNLDTKELIAEFELLLYNSFKEKDKDYTPARTTSGAKKSKDRESKLFKYGLVVIALLLLFIAGSLFNNDVPDPNLPQPNNSANAGNQSPQSENPVNEPEENKETQEPDENKEPEVTPPEKEITGVNLAIEIIKDQCWISVISDGNKVFSGTLSQGDKRVFEGNSEIVITLGNAGAAKVTYNGEELAPLGGDGEVVTPPPFVAKNESQPNG